MYDLSHLIAHIETMLQMVNFSLLLAHVEM